MNNSIIYLVHGFLGKGSDWDLLFKSQQNMKKVDLFSRDGGKPKTLDQWGSWLNQKVQESSSSQKEIRHFLVGYSLGGRIALHALLENPSLWSGAIIVSAHPGLTSAEEQDQRRKADQVWAERFRKEDWTELLKNWNAQAVFKNNKSEIVRHERDFSRCSLAETLLGCSLGVQRDLRSQLRLLKLPILWISGQHDVKFRSISMEMKQLNPQFEEAVVPDSGHRVPWDQPESFLLLFERFLEQNSRKKHEYGVMD